MNFQLPNKQFSLKRYKIDYLGSQNNSDFFLDYSKFIFARPSSQILISIIQNKKEPVSCIIGGSKVSTKINVIANLIKNVNNIIIVGAMANNFFNFKGFEIVK